MENPSRDITPLNQWGCPMKYRPPNTVDRSDPGNVVGNIDEFSDRPIEDADPIENDQYYSRPGFTTQAYQTVASESAEVRRIRGDMRTIEPPQRPPAKEWRNEGNQTLERRSGSMGRPGDWGGGVSRGGPGGGRSTLRDN
jgi:hypothetical protein